MRSRAGCCARCGGDGGRRRPTNAPWRDAAELNAGAGLTALLLSEVRAHPRTHLAPADDQPRALTLTATAPSAGAKTVMRESSIGAPGFEPGTSPTRTVRATRLRHAPREGSSVASRPRPRP